MAICNNASNANAGRLFSGIDGSPIGPKLRKSSRHETISHAVIGDPVRYHFARRDDPHVNAGRLARQVCIEQFRFARRRLTTAAFGRPAGEESWQSRFKVFACQPLPFNARTMPADTSPGPMPRLQAAASDATSVEPRLSPRPHPMAARRRRVRIQSRFRPRFRFCRQISVATK